MKFDTIFALLMTLISVAWIIGYSGYLIGKWQAQRRIDREALGSIKEPKKKLSFKQKLKEFKESFKYYDL